MAKKTEYAGIDYGLGKSNRDTETGIRYGLISQNSVESWIWDEVEYDYVARCPECGNELPEDFDADLESPCPTCGGTIRDGEQYGDEPDAILLTGDYEGFISESEIWVTKSPYYMRAQFCSPCMPGAGNMDTECDNGPKTYCLGHEMFEGGVAPYALYDVLTDAEVKPTKES